MTSRVSLIVATKDRPDELRRLLDSLRSQTAGPAEVIVVDASRESVEPVTADFPELNIRYLRHWPPSAAAQRNAGMQSSDPNATLIGFADDDITFEPQAFAKMMNFWDEAATDVLGASFNLRNYPLRRNGFIKYSSLTLRLGLYSPKTGDVSLSGWHTVIGEVPETQFTKWLPSTAVIFRRNSFKNHIFDEFYQEYSYLEDLDFSYTLSRRGRLAIVADAGFSHFPSSGGRVSPRQFGRFEVRNRLYFVRKHHLSLPRCYLGLLIRLAMSTLGGLTHWNSSLLLRAVGNMEELISQSTVSLSPVSSAPSR